MGIHIQVALVDLAAVKSVPNEGFTREWGSIKFGFSKKGEDFKSYYDHLRSTQGGNLG